MLNFIWPYVFLLLPLPWVIRYLAGDKTEQDFALSVPFGNRLPEDKLVLKNANKNFKGSLIPALLMSLIWLLLLTALARPQWLGEPVILNQEGRPLLLAVDISGSMQTKDMFIQNSAVDRLTVVKQVLNQFIQKRQGDKLGLILFGTNAYLHVPMTFDIVTLNQFLTEAEIGIAGEKTAIGDAIAVAIKQFKNNPQSVLDKNKVLILLSDGTSNAGSVSPIEAAEWAAKQGIKIYTIGFGAEELAAPSFWGDQIINPSADLDEQTLRQVAKITGGEYFRALDPQSLIQIYALLDELEPVQSNNKKYQPYMPLYAYPLALALILLFVLAFISRFLKY